MSGDKQKRKRKEKTPEQKAKTQRRSATPRHVIPNIELVLSCDDERRLLHMMKTAAWIKRRVKAHFRKAIEQLNRDRHWHVLRQAYHDSSEALEKAKKQLERLTKQEQDHKKDASLLEELRTQISEIKKDINKLGAEKKGYAEDLSLMQKRYRVTFDDAREIASHYAKKTGTHSVFGLSIAEDVWAGVEKIIYSDGKKLSSKYEEFCSLRSKQLNRGIVIKEKNNQLVFKVGSIGNIGMKDIDENDLWLIAEMAAVVDFIKNKGVTEDEAVQHLLNTGEVVSVARPCYITIFVENIRGKERFFANITVEGEPLPKLRVDGTPRHEFADKGEIGCDIGASSYAAVSDNFVEMSNLAVRGHDKWAKQERRKQELQRKMARSLKENNPDNYDENGRIKSGKKTWRCSKSYERYRSQYKDICRSRATSRKYALREQVNRLRCHGSTLITEQQSIASWAAKAKEATTRKTKSGRVKNNSRHRMGGSVQRFAPGLFTNICKEKFGEGFVQVSLMFRASQYDHESDNYEKKPLSQRIHHHAQGRASPRDLYSAFLLWCSNAEYDAPDRGLCNRRFEEYYSQMETMISNYKEKGVKVRNSGLVER